MTTTIPVFKSFGDQYPVGHITLLDEYSKDLASLIINSGSVQLAWQLKESTIIAVQLSPKEVK